MFQWKEDRSESMERTRKDGRKATYFDTDKYLATIFCIYINIHIYNRYVRKNCCCTKWKPSVTAFFTSSWLHTRVRTYTYTQMEELSRLLAFASASRGKPEQPQGDHHRLSEVLLHPRFMHERFDRSLFSASCRSCDGVTSLIPPCFFSLSLSLYPSHFSLLRQRQKSFLLVRYTPRCISCDYIARPPKHRTDFILSFAPLSLPAVKSSLQSRFSIKSLQLLVYSCIYNFGDATFSAPESFEISTNQTPYALPISSLKV